MKLNAINEKYLNIERKNTKAQSNAAPYALQLEMLNNLDKHTLAIYKNGKITYYNQRNLKPVFLALKDFNNDFSNCFIADRRISKASAMLFAYGGAKNIVTPIMTKSAKEFFDKFQINAKSYEIADSVLDKNSKIKCPLEKAVLHTDNPSVGYEILKKKVFPRGMEFEERFWRADMTPQDYKKLDKELNTFYQNPKYVSFGGKFYDITAAIQNNTLLNRGLTNIGGCAIPNAIMSNTKEEALERLFMSSLSVTFAFVLPNFILPRYNKHFLAKNGIVKNFSNNEKKIIQLSKEYLTQNAQKMREGIIKTGKELGALEDFQNILKRFEGREEDLRKALLKTHEQILRSDFISTGLLMGSIPWIATSITEYKTGRKGFSATYNMLEEKKISKEQHKKNKIKRLVTSLLFAILPGIFVSKGISAGLTSDKANFIKSHAKNFEYTAGVRMSKTINATKWAFTGFLAKLPSARDKYELRDRIAREGGTFVMFFGGDYIINNILGRLSDKFLHTKIMNTDKFKGQKIGFLKGFTLPVRKFTKVEKELKALFNQMPEQISKEQQLKIINRTKTMGALLYWVSLLANMAILGFTLPRFLNKMLKHSVEKDKAKENDSVNVPDMQMWLQKTKV